MTLQNKISVQIIRQKDFIQVWNQWRIKDEFSAQHGSCNLFYIHPRQISGLELCYADEALDVMSKVSSSEKDKQRSQVVSVNS